VTKLKHQQIRNFQLTLTQVQLANQRNTSEVSCFMLCDALPFHVFLRDTLF